MNRKETAAIVGIIIETYPSLAVKPDFNPVRMIDIWTMMLADIDFRVAKVAVIKACRQNKFPPSVAEIVEASQQVDPTHDDYPSAADAWGEVYRAIQNVGQYRQPTWTNPVIGRAVAAMGWVEICSGENLEADRAHFLKIYESMRQGVHGREETEKAMQLSGVGDLAKVLAGKFDIRKLQEGQEST